MTFQSLVDNLISNTLQDSLPRFLPELIVCATIVALLLVKLFDWSRRIDPFWIALAGTLAAFWYALPTGGISELGNIPRQEIFTGMLVYDGLTVFFRLFLVAFAFWFVILVRMTGLADREDGQDFYTLLLGATLGMCLMASANHLMTVFLAVEMASVPSYVMAGILKGRRRASEAALKYAVYGAGAAGVMLYGISLLAGLLNTAHIPTIATKLAALDIPAMATGGDGAASLMVLALAGLMIMVGLAFKLSAVPFHFWCPDVFEGASAEVDAFLSVASKAAAMALLVRVALGVTVAPPEHDMATQAPIPVHAVSLLQTNDGQPVAAASAAAETPLSPVRSFVVHLLAIIAAVTCTFGNLTAYGQTNIKRLLAYSTIAHAGYMMMAVAAAVQLAGMHPDSARTAVSALVFYLMAYVFMNLGAFSIVAFLRGAMRSEEISDYAGLIRSAPAVSVALVLILVSLIGIPPMAGFMGKFAIFAALVDAGGPLMIGLLVIAGMNTVVSLIYYLRVAKVVCMDPEPETRGPVTVGVPAVIYVLAVALPVLGYGLFPARLWEIAQHATQQLLMQLVDSLVEFLMSDQDPIEHLNRVLAILRRSFVQYLCWGRPYIPPGREPMMEAIADIAVAQDIVADRIAEQIDESGATPDIGDFPMEFTDTHDLGIDFLVEEAIGYQKQDIATLERHVSALKDSPAGQPLAAEALGLAKGHLESLQNLAPKPGASTIVRAGTPAFDND